MSRLNDYSEEELVRELETRGVSCTSESAGYVATLECSAGNESVGNMWIENLICNGQTTIEDLFEWKAKKSGCHGRFLISKAT
jgi:hypothetical protein